MIQPSFREFQKLAKQGNLVPVYDVFSADLLTPVSAYLRIAQGARYSFLLESVEGGEKIARYTFAGAHPEEIFRYANGACVLESRNKLVWEERDPGHIFAATHGEISTGAAAGLATAGGRSDRIFQLRHGAAD
jgi:Anthranilate/para-aminobenzoate synthases component I